CPGGGVQLGGPASTRSGPTSPTRSTTSAGTPSPPRTTSISVLAANGRYRRRCRGAVADDKYSAGGGGRSDARVEQCCQRVFENSRSAGVCLAENRRSRLLVGSVISKSPPRPGAHNAINDLAMPVVPAPCGGRTWLRAVLVVGDRRRVGDPRTAV